MNQSSQLTWCKHAHEPVFACSLTHSVTLTRELDVGCNMQVLLYGAPWNLDTNKQQKKIKSAHLLLPF